MVHCATHRRFYADGTYCSMCYTEEAKRLGLPGHLFKPRYAQCAKHPSYSTFPFCPDCRHAEEAARRFRDDCFLLMSPIVRPGVRYVPVPGDVISMVNFKGELFVATTKGIYKLEGDDFVAVPLKEKVE